jgi:hypothetical protein
MLSRYLTPYRISEDRRSRPWFGVGPVWGNDGRLAGLCVQLGPYGLAVHRGL